MGLYNIYEIIFAKKTNNRKSGRKSPRLFVNISLQCVLSGNQVVYLVTVYTYNNGEPPFGNERLICGKSYLTYDAKLIILIPIIFFFALNFDIIRMVMI